jgi:hypothetical protein
LRAISTRSSVDVHCEKMTLLISGSSSSTRFRSSTRAWNLVEGFHCSSGLMLIISCGTGTWRTSPYVISRRHVGHSAACDVVARA